MSDAVTPENTEDAEQTRKAWVVPAIIVSDVRGTEVHVTRFTDGTSTGPLHVQYGS
jgi:hypothetical protein